MALGEFFTGLFYAQYIASVPYPDTTDFKGKTVIVTGSNTGLGKEAARHFVRLGAAKVIIACRTVSKGEEAKADIAKTNSGSSTVIEVWELDLGSYASVKAFAKKAEGLDRLDVLVENAGMATNNFRTMEENEATITTNVVSTYLLALLLLPKMKQTAQNFPDPKMKPHLVIVSSDVHYLVNLDERKHDNIFDALSDPKIAKMGDRYPTSKLLEVLASREIVKDYMTPASSYPVVFNMLTPGLCQSELAREAGALMTVMKVVLNARTTECGSRTLVHAAHAGDETTGQFLMDCKIKAPSAFVLSEEGAETQTRVWKELSAKLEKISPGILGNL